MIRRVMLQGARAVPELDELERPRRRYTTEEAYAFCERIARGHFSSFALARRFVPEAIRPHVWALYAFARSADDFADEPRYEGRRRGLLEHWEAELERAFHREADHPIFIALADTVDRRKLPIAPFRSLLCAYTMDLSSGGAGAPRRAKPDEPPRTRHRTAADLDQYAAHAAHPIGRIFLYLFGQTDPALHRFADEICSGLQIAKICQDVALDAQRDRVYLPAEDLRHFGVTEEMLRADRATPELRDLVQFEVARARSILQRGRPLIDKLGQIDAGLAFQVALVFHAGTVLLDRIEESGGDVLDHRPRLRATDKAEILARATQTRWPDRGL